MNLNQTDPFGRTVDYLRISITDRCNERCLYCLPENYSDWLPRGEILAYDELLAIVRTTAALGFKRFRVTGGEPLIRPGVVEFIRDLIATPGVESVLLTTNGTRLPELAKPLFDAGLRRINISLDALDPAIYRAITNGDLAPVLRGIKLVKELGFESVKLNTVLMRGKNDGEIFRLLDFAAEHDVAIRFIELMPVSLTEMLSEKNFFPVTELLAQVAARRRTGAAHGIVRVRPGEIFPAEKARRDGRFDRRVERPAFLRALQQDAADVRRQAASVPRQSSGNGFETGAAPAD